jgi:hypothetical protein
VAGQVFPGGAAFEQPGRAGEEPDLVDGRRQLLARGQRDRLAGVLALGGDKFVGARLDRVGELEQRPLPVTRCRVAPPLERLLGRAHRPVDVGLTGHRGRREHLAGGRVDQIRVPPVDGLDRSAVDEVVKYTLVGHHGPPALISRLAGLSFHRIRSRQGPVAIVSVDLGSYS